MGMLEKYRSYIKDLSPMPRLAITTLTGIVLVACAYLAAHTIYYLLSRYVKTSILAAMGLVNLYVSFPALWTQEKRLSGDAARKSGLPPSFTQTDIVAPAIVQTMQAAKPSPRRATAPKMTPAKAAKETPVPPTGTKSVTFADVANEFIAKLNVGGEGDDLPPEEFADDDLL